MSLSKSVVYVGQHTARSRGQHHSVTAMERHPCCGGGTKGNFQKELYMSCVPIDPKLLVEGAWMLSMDMGPLKHSQAVSVGDQQDPTQWVPRDGASIWSQ